LTGNVIIIWPLCKLDVSASVNAGYPYETWIMAGGGDIDLMESTVYRAIKPWVPRDREPLILKKGEFVNIEREDNQYKGFAWCAVCCKYDCVPQ
jgi:hypothetical protein